MLGKSLENVWQSTNLELGNNNTILTVISTFYFLMSCCKLLHDIDV